MGKNKTRSKKKEKIDDTKVTTAFNCKKCGAMTFGQPVRIKTLNYCKYCVEKGLVK